jgi:hypothetical protein
MILATATKQHLELVTAHVAMKLSPSPVFLIRNAFVVL